MAQVGYGFGFGRPWLELNIFVLVNYSMSQFCSKKIAKLQVIKSQQATLDGLIADFAVSRNNQEIGAEEKSLKLLSIYQLKKEIIKLSQEIRKIELLLERPIYKLQFEDVSLILDHLEDETNNNITLNRSELVFLYDQYFLKQEDLGSRIKKILLTRDYNSDMPIVFDCEPSQIIRNEEELKQALKDRKEIKAYVGELFSDIFNLLPDNVEQVYTKFPEGKIRLKTIEIKEIETKDDYIKALTENNIKEPRAVVLRGIPKRLDSPDVYQKKLVILKFSSVLGDSHFASAILQDFYDTVKKLGLKPCSLESGLQLRLQYPEQPIAEKIQIALPAPIIGWSHWPATLDLRNQGGELCLEFNGIFMDKGCSGHDIMVFSRE